MAPWLLVVLVVAAAAVCFLVVQPVIGRGPAPPGPPADPARLEAMVRALSVEFFPRHHARPDNLDRAAAWIRARFEEAGAAVTEQPYEADGRTYRNVIARLGPPESRGGELLVVGAHYDACGPFPAADDNASGVAGLVELARLLAGRPLGIPVELVAFTLEEPPHFREASMGSAVHARSLASRGARVRAMLSLEMLGCYSDEPGSQRFPVAPLRLLYPSRGDGIVIVSRLADIGLTRRLKHAMRGGAGPLPVRSMNGPAAVPGVDFSDHRSYWSEGFPAAMITDTAFYRNPRYHTPDDTWDTLDYGRMARAVDSVYAAVLALARP